MQSTVAATSSINSGGTATFYAGGPAMPESINNTLLETSRKSREWSRDLVAALQMKTRESQEIMARSKELVTYSKSLARIASTVDLSLRLPSFTIPNQASAFQYRQTSLLERAAKIHFVAATFRLALRN